MAAVLLNGPISQFFGDDAKPLSGGKVYTYAAGTTTAQATYSDYALTTQNQNPTILDAFGKGTFYLLPANYKIDVQTSAGVSIDGFPRDNVPGAIPATSILAGTATINISGNAATATSAAAGTLTGSILAAGVTLSSLTTVGTIGTGVWNAGSVTSSGVVNAVGSMGISGTADLGGLTITALTTLKPVVTFRNATSGTLSQLIGINGGGFELDVGSGLSAALIVSSVGAMRMPEYGAGTATFDASGNITSSSDERLKNRIAPLGYGLAEVLQLRPVQFGYTKESGLDSSGLYGGFLAQDVLAVMPLAVGQSKGFYSLSDRPILGALVTAASELNSRIDSIDARLSKGGL